MVTVTEPQGAEVFAFIEKGGKEFVARFDPRTGARAGQPIDFVMDMTRMHIFDSETETALV
jgi:multiple sugar transport system ATP-binding protein